MELKKIIKRGLIAVAPLSITIAILYWLFSFLETGVGPLVEDLIGSKYYFPGLGVICAFLIIFLIGALINTWIIRHLANYFDQIFKKIPLFKSLYTMIKNVLHFLQASPDDRNKKVVQVMVGEQCLIGLVTREDFSDISSIHTNKIAVFIPMSYQIGGYTVFVARDKVEPLDISVEDALQYTLTAWTKAPEKPQGSL